MSMNPCARPASSPAWLPALVGALALAQPAGRPAAASPDRYTLIHAGTLLAVPGSAPQSQVTVVVRNDRIAGIEKGFLTEAAGAAPGSEVEVHRPVRPLRAAGPDGRPRAPAAASPPSRGGAPSAATARRPTPAEGAVNAVVYARRSLNAGFTTLRDVGSDDQSVYAVRNAINAGRMIGPRILVSGSAHRRHRRPRRLAAVRPDRRPAGAACATAPATARWSAARPCATPYKLGADVIKFTSTGGFSDNTGTEPQMFPDEIEAIVATAHMLGLKAAVHAYSPIAIKAGGARRRGLHRARLPARRRRHRA